MKKVVNIPIVLILICLVTGFVSCDTNNDLVSKIDSNTFVNFHNSFHNEYFKNNSIETVTETYNNYPDTKRKYYYNTFGDLYRNELINVDENGNETINEISSQTYELSYEDDFLTKLSYNKESIITHSELVYEENVITKFSDYRDKDLFYFTDYTYTNNILTYSKYTRLNSFGVRFGTSPVTFEYNYFYNDHGNLVRRDLSYQGEAYEKGESYEYPEKSNLPNRIGETTLTYSHF